MRRLLCTLLILTGASATAAEFRYLVKHEGPGQEIIEEQKLLGEVIPLDAPVFIDGEEMVSASEVRNVTLLYFNKYGTAFGVFQTTGEKLVKIQISAVGKGSQGDFTIDGWPYLVSQDRVMGMNDSLVNYLYRKIGPRKVAIKSDRTLPTLPWIAGGAGAHLLGSVLMHESVVATGLGMVAAGVVAGGAKYIYNIRDEFKKSHFALGYKVDWFTKPMATGVEGYKKVPARPGIPEDVLIKFKGQDTPVSMRQIIADKKTRYRKDDCVQFLQELRGNGSNLLSKIIPK